MISACCHLSAWYSVDDKCSYYDSSEENSYHGIGGDVIHIDSSPDRQAFQFQNFDTA